MPVTFTNGAYYNFPDSQKICDGVYFIKAKGHTNGNSMVIAEDMKALREFAKTIVHA
ncbi:MAG: hypothetical protein IJQ95_00805 [Paludibacteraceae bacterium]|nr:hypothetical protein [Paludibacteraceae bacterium]